MNQKQEQKLAVIYYRVSTAEQAERGFSLENQKDACLSYAAKNNIKVVKLFSDEGESAKTADRPGLQEMLKFCANRKNNVSAVIVYKLDRLSRNVNDYAALSGFFQKSKIQLLSTTEAIGDTAFGKFMGNIMASVAQLDNDVRSERVIEGLQKCAKKGRLPHKVRLGYLNFTNPDGSKTIILDPKKSELVKYTLTEFSKGIYTQEELRTKLNKLGLQTNEGREISSQMMHKMLTGKFYHGVIESGKYGEIQGAHPKLIGEEVYWKNQKLLRRQTKGELIANSRADEEFPLRHFCLCPYCGRLMTASFSTNKIGKSYGYYHCYNGKCPSRINVGKDKLEKEFVKYLKQLTPKETLLGAFKEVIIDRWQVRYTELGAGEKKVLAELEKLKQEKQGLLDLVKRNLLDDDDFREEFAKIKQKIMDKQLELNDSRIEEFDLDEAVTYVFAFIKTIPDYWQEKATYQQRVKLQSLIFPEKVYFDKEKFGTPKLAHIYQMKTAHEGGKSTLVALRGIEPRFGG